MINIFDFSTGISGRRPNMLVDKIHGHAMFSSYPYIVFLSFSNTSDFLSSFFDMILSSGPFAESGKQDTTKTVLDPMSNIEDKMVISSLVRN